MDKKDKPYCGIYDDIEYCMKELLLARAIFGNIKTTEDQYNAMQKALALVLFYCPKEIKSLVQGTLTEAIMRKTYYEKIWKGETI